MVYQEQTFIHHSLMYEGGMWEEGKKVEFAKMKATIQHYITHTLFHSQEDRGRKTQLCDFLSYRRGL